jgi:hypothetical protein
MPGLKFLFEFITEQFSLFDNIVYNYFAMAAVGVVAFSIAFRLVGILYDLGIIHGRFMGSLLHWLLRFVVFVVLFIFVSLIILFVKLIITIPTWVWFTLLAIVIISILAYVARKIYVKNNKLSQKSM